MKLLAVTDIHQMISKWKELVKICKEKKPEVVAIAGDLFPKDTYIIGQLSFMKHFSKYIKQIKSNGCEVVVVLGNDDNQNLIPQMEQGDKDGLWHYIPEKVIEIGGHEFVGMPWVPDYPFGYKYWCRGDSPHSLRIEECQLTEPVLVNKDNNFETIPDYKKYLKEHKTIWESLTETAAKVKNMNKSIWLIHCPPASLELDFCARGARVGSPAVKKFIDDYQPLLTIHGHIHESPEYNGKKWFHKQNNTTAIQCGQVSMRLHYTMIELMDGVIIEMKNSIYE